MRRAQPITTALGATEREIWATTPFAAIGLVWPADAGRIRFEFRNQNGVSAILIDPEQVPPELRLPCGTNGQPARLTAHRDETRAIDRLFATWDLDAVCTAPIEADGERGLFYAALDASRSFTDADQAQLAAVAARIDALAREPESEATFDARTTRVDALAEILPALGSALDIRDVFAQLSGIARRVLPHDSAVVGLHNDDFSRLHLHALSTPDGVTLPAVVDNPYPNGLNEGWLFANHRDLAANPIERRRVARNASFRSALRVAIWLDGTVVGVLDISSYQPHRFTDDDVAVARRMADYVTLVLSHQRLSDAARKAEALRERSANLEMLEKLLHTLSGVLDVREVFDRVSAIARQVLAHDAMAIAVTLDHPPRLRVHAISGFGPEMDAFETPMPEPWLMRDPWEYRLADFGDDPVYSKSPTVRAGMRSVLCIPVRFDGKLHSAVNFYARTPGAFTQDDVIVARRITDHIKLALSHERLAEEARRSEELRAGAANLELLDELLTAETHNGQLEEVFDRVSAIAQRVLPHDTLLLPVALPDGKHARIHARGGSSADAFPDVVEIPQTIVSQPGWQYDLIDDLQVHATERYSGAASRGYRSALRVSVRLEDRYAGALVFLSFEPSRYKAGDVMVARRIADRITLVLARDRGVEAAKREQEAMARAAKLEARVRALTDELDARTGLRRVVGDSPVWRDVLLQATRVAATETTVLLRGESGTGKEIVARFVHRASGRNAGPFVALNCAALPEQLLEAELFGYERGAFTGAAQSKPGLLEQAGRGTLFLDEVGEMSLSAQAKFLRVLQEREFQRLGGTRVLRADARIIAATNRDLEKAMTQGSFREDLFYRLNVFAIRLPPLRERRDDVLTLANAFIVEIGKGLGRPPAGLARDAREKLLAYHWPGNARELRNVLERAAILCDGGLIVADHLALTIGAPTSNVPAPATAAWSAPAPGWSAKASAERNNAAERDQAVDRDGATASPWSAKASAERSVPGSDSTPSDLASMERQLIEQALQQARYNKSKAAKTLGLTRAQLYVRMRRHGFE